MRGLFKNRDAGSPLLHRAEDLAKRIVSCVEASMAWKIIRDSLWDGVRN